VSVDEQSWAEPAQKGKHVVCCRAKFPGRERAQKYPICLPDKVRRWCSCLSNNPDALSLSKLLPAVHAHPCYSASQPRTQPHKHTNLRSKQHSCLPSSCRAALPPAWHTLSTSRCCVLQHCAPFIPAEPRHISNNTQQPDTSAPQCRARTCLHCAHPSSRPSLRTGTGSDNLHHQETWQQHMRAGLAGA
jgi:hypothetical protein